ncbi:hypothetical protein [Streptomyces sp. NPDC127038]|uniref:hypothetical protein n=1 Tax=Streptomyces sp. NPDC127038 TaxID=3347114 RepID=UPI003667835A
MGFKRNPKIYRLKWEDGDYSGLEVSIRSLNMGQLLEAKSGKSASGKDGLEGTVELLADRIVDWNLEDEQGTPVPATLEAMKGEDDDLILDIINKWMEAVSGVPAPLEMPSPSGEISQVASIPTEALSPSLAS